jgi:hypothetical protein
METLAAFIVSQADLVTDRTSDSNLMIIVIDSHARVLAMEAGSALPLKPKKYVAPTPTTRVHLPAGRALRMVNPMPVTRLSSTKGIAIGLTVTVTAMAHGTAQPSEQRISAHHRQGSVENVAFRDTTGNRTPGSNSTRTVSGTIVIAIVTDPTSVPQKEQGRYPDVEANAHVKVQSLVKIVR